MAEGILRQGPQTAQGRRGGAGLLQARKGGPNGELTSLQPTILHTPPQQRDLGTPQFSCPTVTKIFLPGNQNLPAVLSLLPPQLWNRTLASALWSWDNSQGYIRGHVLCECSPGSTSSSDTWT